MVCNKQFITLGHCKIWSHFTRTLYFHSPSARDNTVATHEISRHMLTHVISLMYIMCACLSWSKKRRWNYVGQMRACSKSVLGGKI